jgi:subtilase family serine protease
MVIGAGSTLQVSDTTINQGGGSAAASITQYYLSSYTSKNTASTLLNGSRRVPALTAGGSASGTTTVIVPSNMAVGSYYLLACADDTNLVPETNETNNCAATPTKLQVGPDLIETGVSSSPMVIGAGSTLQVTDTTINQGGGSAAASITQYYLSSYTTKNTASTLLSGSRQIPGLTAGASSSGTSTVTVPSNMAAGSYYLLACADDTNLVAETNESNNCAATPSKLQVVHP